MKDYKELELQMTETKTQLKVRDSQLKQTDEENRTLNQVKIISFLVKGDLMERTLMYKSQHSANLNFLFLSLCVYLFENCDSEF